MSSTQPEVRSGYDSREPLKCCAYPNLGRQIGVLADNPFHHQGLNADYVDISRETPFVNTRSYGTCYPIKSTDAEVRRATEVTIADLDRIIAELAEHRERLARELARNHFNGDCVDRATPQQPRTVVDVELPFFEEALS